MKAGLPVIEVMSASEYKLDELEWYHGSLAFSSLDREEKAFLYFKMKGRKNHGNTLQS